MANALISLRNVCKDFGDVHAVAGVDLDIGRGEIFGLIGHNGAGKSTLFKMMLGLLPASSGEIRIDGTLVGGRAFRSVRRRIGYLPENVVLYDNLSGLETLYYFADLKSAPRAQALPLLDKVGLRDAAKRRVRGYSKGMRQRLGLAQALLGEPQLLFLDEPTNGLDPEAIRKFYLILHEMQAAGVTVVITSHILSEIQERVDRLAIMKLGKVQALGTLQSLRDGIDLPLRIEAHVAEGSGESLRALLEERGMQRVEVSGDRLQIECARRDKMVVLEMLTAQGDRVRDLHVREPSLEDVFLGYAR